MARVVSIHEYELKDGVGPDAFEAAIRHAEARGLFALPGLIGHHFMRGLKGMRVARYAAIWIYESREAWERLWGTPEQPLRYDDYPPQWRTWEEEFLIPLLDRNPDTIRFTTYEELDHTATLDPRRSP